MSRRFRRYLIGSVTLLGLTGCSTLVIQERPAWRAQAENACLARGVVQETSYERTFHEISGPGICGLTHPFKVTALAGGTVTINSTQTLGCPMIEALDTWIKEVVQPAAQARFGEPVVRINSMGSYSCRGINNMSGASLSEHAFGNAIDVGGFVLASGRELNIMRGFNGQDEQERAFLHEAHAGACGYFTTVLGPGYNIFHYNHFHLDLAMHGSTSRGMRRYCKPVPQKDLPEPPKRDDLPDPPPIDEEMDIARAPMPAPSLGAGGSSFVASLPPPSVSRSSAYSPVPRQPLVAADRIPEPAPRRRPAGPPPVVTFAVDDPGPRLRDIPRAEPKPDTYNGTEGEQGMGAGEDAAQAPGNAFDPAAAEPAPRTRPVEGRPSDWDATSSIRR